MTTHHSGDLGPSSPLMEVNSHRSESVAQGVGISLPQRNHASHRNLPPAFRVNTIVCESTTRNVHRSLRLLVDMWKKVKLAIDLTW